MNTPTGETVGLTALGDPGAKRTVLLCHPTPGCSGFDPDPIATASRSTRIVSVDRPGYGATPPPDAGELAFGEPACAELALLDQLVESGTHVDAVVGWGFGGLIALRLAAARPDDVRRVALIQTPRPRSPLYGLVARRARAWMLQHHDTVLAYASTLGGTHIESLSLLGTSVDDEALRMPGLRERCERMLDEAVRQGEAGLEFDRRAARRHDWARLARDIRARVLVLYGERDARLGPDDASWFVRHLSEVEVEIVAEAGPLAIASEWGRVLDFAFTATNPPNGGHPTPTAPAYRPHS